jgi:hypothetical protein
VANEGHDKANAYADKQFFGGFDGKFTFLDLPPRRIKTSILP